MNIKLIAGLIVVLMAGGFITGCIEAPTEPEVKYITDEKAILEAWNEGAEWGHNEALKQAEIIFDEQEQGWTDLVNSRDVEWRRAVEDAYQVGLEDGTFQTVTDLSKILGKLSFFGVI